MVESETKVKKIISSVLDIEDTKKSHRNILYDIVMFYLIAWSQMFVNKVILAYEVKLNKTHEKYPDFLLIHKNKLLRIEVKDKENYQTIAKEMNSIDKDCDFWYVICGNTDIEKIRLYLTKKGKKLRLIKVETLETELKKYFK